MCGTVLAGERANINCSVRKMLPTCCIWDLFSISHQIGSRTEGIGGTRPKGKKEDEEISRSWKTIRRDIHHNHTFQCVMFGLWRAKWTFKIQLRETTSLFYCPFVIAIVFFPLAMSSFSKSTQPSGPLCPWQFFQLWKLKSLAEFLFVIRQTVDLVLEMNWRSHKAPLSTILIVLGSDFGLVFK